MTVESIMTPKVVSVKADCPLEEILKKLYAYGVSCLIVCEEDTPVGIISERDIVGIALNLSSGKGETRRRADELMTSPLVTIEVDAPIAEALEIATERRIRHLPVVDAEGALVGLVTQSNLLHALADA